jgi:N6-L-threonylcarbamoyladenine synthase
MNILAIDTSCDETAVAVTRNTKACSNVVWSQASLHAKFGGVMPSLAQRQHEERIDFCLEKALGKEHKNLKNIDCLAVTIGPGLGITLGVGINKAKELANKHKLPLIPINHIEAHLLSPLVNSETRIQFPALGLVLSGGTTVLCLVNGIGKYEILAETGDDALGEALDKGARLLGLGYPGGALLEKFARDGDPKKYKLPIPLINDVNKNRFSYSGLKTAFVRLFNTIENPSKQDISDLATTFQEAAFKHVENVLNYQINHSSLTFKQLLFGGGVANNILLKKRLRKLLKNYNISLCTPKNKKLNGDNAGMIGVCAYLKYKNSNLNDFYNYDYVDRNPKLNILN